MQLQRLRLLQPAPKRRNLEGKRHKKGLWDMRNKFYTQSELIGGTFPQPLPSKCSNIRLSYLLEDRSQLILEPIDVLSGIVGLLFVCCYHFLSKNYQYCNFVRWFGLISGYWASWVSELISTVHSLWQQSDFVVESDLRKTPMRIQKRSPKGLLRSHW